MSKMSPPSKDLKKLSHRFQVAFALFCAKQVNHLLESKEAHECVRLVELWLNGEATAEECLVVGKAVHAYGPSINNYADYAAAYAADATAAVRAAYAHAADYAALAAAAADDAFAAADDAFAAADDAFAAAAANYIYADIRKAQWAFYKELLSFDTTFEKVVLV